MSGNTKPVGWWNSGILPSEERGLRSVYLNIYISSNCQWQRSQCYHGDAIHLQTGTSRATCRSLHTLVRSAQAGKLCPPLLQYAVNHRVPGPAGRMGRQQSGWTRKLDVSSFLARFPSVFTNLVSQSRLTPVCPKGLPLTLVAWTPALLKESLPFKSSPRGMHYLPGTFCTPLRVSHMNFTTSLPNSFAICSALPHD